MSAAHLCSGPCHALHPFRAGSVERRHALSGGRCNISAIAAPEREAETFSVPSPSSVEVPKGLNKYSSKVTQPKSQGASQAMLYATGLSEEDMNKPQVHYFLKLLSHQCHVHCHAVMQSCKTKSCPSVPPCPVFQLE